MESFMDALTLVLQLLFKSFVVMLPVLVGALAFRRLARSKTSNAWIYATTCLFAAVTAAGLMPWAIGLSSSSWMFFVLAAFCPAIWFGVTTICDFNRKGTYSSEVQDVYTLFFKHTQNKVVEPLVLKNPVADMPAPVFQHKEPANTDAPSSLMEEDTPQAIGEKSVLEIAREMRRNKSADERRPKLLPAPTVDELSFIKRPGTA
jgi:hypothetical protein